jgi:mycothiol synthase
MPGLEFRHPSEADLEIITDILNRSRRGLPFQRSMTPQEIGSESLLDPDYDPESAWLAFEDGAPTAYGEAFVDRQRLAQGRNDSNGRLEVVPEVRGRGIEQQLLRRIVDLTKGKGLESVQFWCSEKDTWKISLLKEAGSRDVHHYFSMVWKGSPLPDKTSWPEGIKHRHRMFKEASDEELRDALALSNEAFSELFNNSPWPLERLVNFRATTEDVLRLTFAYSERRLAGVCWSEDSVPYNAEHGLKDGWIDVLAVSGPFRRRGLGRALILDGMDWLLGRGLNVIHLGVDAENRNALGLYTSLGFSVLHENITYVLDVRADR